MKHKIAIILIILLTLGLAAPVLAQQAEVVTATVDRNSVTTDETIVLSVVVNGFNARPELPTLTGFNVVGSSQSTQISVINGDMSVQGVYQFRLQPTQTGTLTIDPVTVTVNGQSFSTRPMQVEVKQGAAVPGQMSPAEPAPAPSTLNGRELFVEAAVDKTNPYQGEQVTYTFRFYQAVNLPGQVSYRPPAFTGLWNDVEPLQQSYNVAVDGRAYLVTEVSHILFPTVAGEVMIEPTQLIIPGGLWQADTTLQTEPVTLDVQPLPAGAPLSFKGAVGKFGLSATVDKQETKVGEPITLNVEISGQGNVGSMGDPAPAADGNWRAFSNDNGTYTEVVNGRLRGTKSYEWLMSPNNGGQWALPLVEYSYFDPDTATYETLTSEPVVVNVEGTAVTYTPAQPGATPVVNHELRPMKAVTAVQDARSPLTQQPLFWLLWLLPLGLVIGQVAHQKRQAHLLATADERRSSQASQKAEKALKQAGKHDDPYAEIGRILITYLEEKLGVSVRGMTSDGRTALLKSRGVSDRTIANVEICLAQAEAGRFAPGGSGKVDDLLQHVLNTVEKLEKYLA
ncbi:MAG TPA: BatD family protein [Chloroflexota bacterium]|nr:BatD family protein [Chloroflexota bacterium]